MHAKHRNGPANGYRSNVMGMGGMPSASRIPPEGAMRSQRIYNSDYRSYSRGGYASGDGRLKQFQQPVPPSRGADIFLEAGRLAAEYLVCKGVLPPNALSGKWQNDSLRNKANFPGFGSHDVDNAGNGRGSVHSRLGNAGLDVGPRRRKYCDDSNVISPRSSGRERKKSGSSWKNYGSEVNRELSEKVKASQGMDVDCEPSVGRRDEQVADKDGKSGTQYLSPGEISREVESDEAEVVKEEINDVDGFRQKHDEKNVATSSEREDGLAAQAHVDLTKHCKFVDVPTRARSSLTIRNSKSDQAPVNKDENIIYTRELPEGSGVDVVDIDIDSSAVSTVEHEPFVTNTTRSVCKDPEADEGLSEIGRSNPMLIERGEKRAMDIDTGVKEDVKKLKQLVRVLDARPDGSPLISSSMENDSSLQEQKNSPTAHSNLSTEPKSLDVSLISKDRTDSCEFIQEKQLFPGSFKTCDLNLVGNGDVSEHHDAERMLVFSSVTQTGKAATPTDVDLSISNNDNLPNNKNGKDVSIGNEIEVIDLEKDTAPEPEGPEDKTFCNPERRGGTIFSDLYGFPNNANNGNEIPDVQDGYGLMISELLAHDSLNCSVPAELNSLHSHMDLPNSEGILADEDSIYMSLGEIPISLLGAWEQPTQDYGKPY